MEVYKNRLIAENVDDDKTSTVSIALTTVNRLHNQLMETIKILV